ncbi:aminopeptidase [Ketogulonicigenium robustum]|uniref:Aminopeptidase n=1 Tax=Ketogulonicigenium robustum TaxID=92947 RepID=A0A1W6P2D2_9RHOB|nr:aminopeptidase [Ketogulonicigenium robustum]ARO15604.1 aminopeptidase [Ketogulonicigenium robustum]
MTSSPTIDPDMIDRLAEVAVKVGLDLHEGQDLVLTAPASALPLVRRIAAHAYKAGAGVVVPILSDEDVTLARFENANDASFDVAPGWLHRGMAEAYGNNAARLAISGDNPMMLSAQDPAKVARVNRANSIASKPAMEKITGFDVNWTIVSYPNAAWAKLVFPDLPEPDAIAALARAIFAASRVDQPDPVAAWAAHNANLAQRSGWLNGQRFASLHFTGPGTDLIVGLADEHAWKGGASPVKNGITCNPNIPTEEVFTTPHALRVEGHVSATKPLSHNGTLIENIRVRFEEGRIVEAHATKGEEVLQRVIDSDEGARRLGEVALVPHSSPISASGVLFYNTLFDENAACHIALGQCYSDCFTDPNMSAEQIKARGGNSSMIHIDWMIGSGQVDIDGVAADGTRTPVFRQGEWAF